MTDIRQTKAFSKWLHKMADHQARAVIARRIERVAGGNLGDVKAVGGKVSELRVNYGPGYRVYFTRSGETVIVLLCGGNKSSQKRDIAAAQKMAKEL